MRIGVWGSMIVMTSAAACASVPTAGVVGEGSSLRPRIVSVDTQYPPRFVSVELDQPGHVALLLVAPGHSASLLFPADSTADNRLSAGQHQLRVKIPGVLVQLDSLGVPDRAGRGRARVDSSILNPGRQRYDTVGRRSTRMTPLPLNTPTYLLLVTSPKPLAYQRIVDRTAGVSIPTVESEALNAVAKAIKSTIADEPRDLAGYFQRIELRRRG